MFKTGRRLMPEVHSGNKMCSKETMIDTRPGTSTVGTQCSIWDRPPEQPLPQGTTDVIETEHTAPGNQLDVDCSALFHCGEVVSERQILNLRNTIHKRCTIEQTDQKQTPTRTAQDAVNTPSSLVGHRRSNRLDDDSYALIVDMLKGRFNIPVRQRTTKHRAALVRIWRNKGRYTVDSCKPENLYLNGKRVLRESEVGILVKHYKESISKNHGARAIKRNLGTAFAGLTEKRILQVTKRQGHGKMAMQQHTQQQQQQLTLQHPQLTLQHPQPQQP